MSLADDSKKLELNEPSTSEAKPFVASNSKQELVIYDSDSEEEVSKEFDDEEDEDALNLDYFMVDLGSLQLKASNKVVQITAVNEAFFNMIQVLKSYSEIGVVFLGNEISREKPIDFIAFSCPTANYVMNVNLETMKFLKEILESNKIMKIIHGCHLVSDALCHQHEIKLSYIYDTMVIDALLQKENKKRCFPKQKFRNWRQCLSFYFLIKYRWNDECYYKFKGQKLLSKMPLSENGQSYVRRLCLLLPELKMLLNRLLFEPINNSMQNFLKSYRNASDIEYQALRASEEFQHLLLNQSHIILDDVSFDIPVASCTPKPTSNVRVFTNQTSIGVQVDSDSVTKDSPQNRNQVQNDQTELTVDKLNQLNGFNTISKVRNNIKKKVIDDANKSKSAEVNLASKSFEESKSHSVVFSYINQDIITNLFKIKSPSELFAHTKFDWPLVRESTFNSQSAF